MEARISPVIPFLGLVTLLEAGDTLAQSAGGTLGLTASPNQIIYHAGDKLTVSVSIDDPGVAANADLFFGVLMPNGTIQAFTDSSFNFVTCSLANVAACHPIVANVPLAAPFTFDQPAFPYKCVVTQSGSTVTFNCTPPIPGFNTSNPMNLDVNGSTLFSFLRDDGRFANCSLQFNTLSKPLKYHALCDVKGRGSAADTCGFDGTQ